MEKRRVLIVSTFYDERENSRAYMAEKYFKEKGYDVKVVCSDFSHALKKKKKYKNKNNKIIINTLNYKSNISIKRIISHIKFSLDAKKIIDRKKTDLIYVNLPPNILGYLLIKNKKCKVIIDIIDLWPEALPIPKKIKKLFNYSIGKIWKYFRSYSIKKSDYVITHVNYFYSKLNLDKVKNSKVIYLCKTSNPIPIPIKQVKNSKIKIGYLGNISHIYDFDSLIKIGKTLNATIEIIGKGEKEEWLLNKLKEEKVKFNFYGPIYDENKKIKILSDCDFGFNGYKESTDVAMSYKSIDYFSYNLPIINSAKGDTWDLIGKEGIGVNYSTEDLKSLYCLMRKVKIDKMKIKTLEVYKNNFLYLNYKNNVDVVLGYKFFKYM